MGNAMHIVAWDGVGMTVPANWNLAAYAYERGACRVQLEDDYSRRAVVEWTRPKKAMDATALRQRGEKAAATWRAKATAHEALDLDDSPGWHAMRLQLPDKEQVVVIYGQPSGDRLLVVWGALFFGPDDTEQPGPFARRFVRHLEAQTGPTRLWAVYDMRLQLPSGFGLTSTSLEAGRKLLVFRHRFRRLCVWQFSIASMVLKDHAPAPWCAEFLNRTKVLRGPRFQADGDTIVTRRHWWRPFGHADEIGRWCFRYAFRITLDPERNRMLLWAFQYRKASDLAWWDDMREAQEPAPGS